MTTRSLDHRLRARTRRARDVADTMPAYFERLDAARRLLALSDIAELRQTATSQTPENE